MSTTPRTDAAKEKYLTGKIGFYDVLNEARELETELARLRARAEKAEAELAEISSIAEKWEDDALRYAINAEYWQSRAEKSEAEIATERARHNALRQAVLDVLCDPEGRACFHGSNADRAAIDAAMKEASK